MNRNLSASAGWIAIAAFVLHLAWPSGENFRQGPAPGLDQSVGSSNSPPASGLSGKLPGAAKPGVEGPWRASQDFFDSPDATEFDVGKTSAILQCAKDPACSGSISASFGVKSNRLEFMLATVPDPLHTRLGLVTDTSIQAIQRAASLAGWDFATQWLPWNDSIDPGEKDPAKRREQRDVVRELQRQPGLLIFRQHDESAAFFPEDDPHHVNPRVLFVFLVGETPTAGVNPAPFQLARAYMRALGEGDTVGAS